MADALVLFRFLYLTVFILVCPHLVAFPWLDMLAKIFSGHGPPRERCPNFLKLIEFYWVYFSLLMLPMGNSEPLGWRLGLFWFLPDSVTVKLVATATDTG
jgi:hypothetical protein